MNTIKTRNEDELTRLYDRLNKAEPGSEEYDKVLGEISKLTNDQIEMQKVDDAAKDAKKDRRIKIGTFVVGLIVAPVVDVVCKRSLAGFIGKIEQMETFTSSAGRSIGSWFRFKN